MKIMRQFSLLTFLCIFFPGIASAETIISKTDVRQYNLGLGKNVFQNNCIKCHADMNSEAPQLHSVYDWERRIMTPLKILIEHAVNGHGKMPAKGGFEDLTEREVSAAVAYVVDQSRRLIIRTNGNIALNQNELCNKSENRDCSATQVDNTMLLELIWLMTNKNKNAK